MNATKPFSIPKAPMDEENIDILKSQLQQIRECRIKEPSETSKNWTFVGTAIDYLRLRAKKYSNSYDKHDACKYLNDLADDLLNKEKQLKQHREASVRMYEAIKSFELKHSDVMEFLEVDSGFKQALADVEKIYGEKGCTQ